MGPGGVFAKGHVFPAQLTEYLQEVVRPTSSWRDWPLLAGENRRFTWHDDGDRLISATDSVFAGMTVADAWYRLEYRRSTEPTVPIQFRYYYPTCTLRVSSPAWLETLADTMQLVSLLRGLQYFLVRAQRLDLVMLPSGGGPDALRLILTVGAGYSFLNPTSATSVPPVHTLLEAQTRLHARFALPNVRRRT